MAALAGALVMSLLFFSAPAAFRGLAMTGGRLPAVSGPAVPGLAGPALAAPERVKASLASAVSWAGEPLSPGDEAVASQPGLAPISRSLSRAEGRSAAFLRAAPEFGEEPPSFVEPEAAPPAAAPGASAPVRGGPPAEAVWNYKERGRSDLMGRGSGPVRNLKGQAPGGLALPARVQGRAVMIEMIEQLRTRILADPGMDPKARAQVLEKLEAMAAISPQPEPAQDDQ